MHCITVSPVFSVNVHFESWWGEVVIANFIDSAVVYIHFAVKIPPEELHIAVLRELLSDVSNRLCAGQEFLPFIHRRLCLRSDEAWWFKEWQAPPQEKALKLYTMLMAKGKNVVYQLFLALLDSSHVLPDHYDLAITLKKKCETFNLQVATCPS